MDWATLPLRKYAVFTGRARRKEYWLFALLCMCAGFAVGIVEMILGFGGGYGPLSVILMLAVLIPSLAVGARRLHDIDRSGWWLLLGLVPLVGTIVLIVFFVLKGTDGANRFGPDPLLLDELAGSIAS